MAYAIYYNYHLTHSTQVLFFSHENVNVCSSKFTQFCNIWSNYEWNLNGRPFRIIWLQLSSAHSGSLAIRAHRELQGGRLFFLHWASVLKQNKCQVSYKMSMVSFHKPTFSHTINVFWNPRTSIWNRRHRPCIWHNTTHDFITVLTLL